VIEPSLLLVEADAAGVRLIEARRCLRRLVDMPKPEWDFFQHILEIPSERRAKLLAAALSNELERTI